MTIKIYNKLPEHLKAETNFKKFTNSLKNMLIKKAYYSINEYFEYLYMYIMF
jgi:hypothetical protein